MFNFKYKLFCLLGSLNITNSAFINSQLPLIRNYNRNLIPIVMINYDPGNIINQLAKSSDDLDKWNLNDFLQEVNKHNIDSVNLIKSSNEITSLVAIDNKYDNLYPSVNNLHYIETGISKFNDIIIDTLIKNDIYYKITQIQTTDMNISPIDFILNGIFAYFIFSLGISLYQRLSGQNMNIPGSPMNPMNIAKIKSNSIINSDDIETSFNDVAGCDEAKYELQEIVEFLKDPEKYYAAGAKIPKGVLLEGPPGTGKTLLARAVAGEAGVSFIQISASEFIQMFVGVGASRVRDLFNMAKKNSPCVVFIDEIDAVGRKRGESINGGGNEEREQTLNQILTNMDGFDKTESLVVLAATNRADILDSALTRSGRFDRKVTVGMPDLFGRREILNVHLKNKFVEENTNLDEIAVLTSGFSGADIENLANEAVILALRNNRSVINDKNLIDAFEKIVIGLPKIRKKENYNEELLVSYHEAGHTIIALLFNDMFDVRKVTINANTNGAGGYTLFTPKEKFNSYPTKKYLLANILISMGGRAAETILFNDIKNHNDMEIEDNNYNVTKVFNNIPDLEVTTGASQDLKQADNIIRQYIELFGIESKILKLYNLNEYDINSKTIQNYNNPYISLSDKSKTQIDEYISIITDYALKKCINILENNKDILTMLAKDLQKEKSLNMKYLEKLKIVY